MVGGYKSYFQKKVPLRIAVWKLGTVVVWQVTALPMSCYIVRKTTTLSVPQSHGGYLWPSRPLGAL